MAKLEYATGDSNNQLGIFHMPLDPYNLTNTSGAYTTFFPVRRYFATGLHADDPDDPGYDLLPNGDGTWNENPNKDTSLIRQDSISEYMAVGVFQGNTNQIYIEGESGPVLAQSPYTVGGKPFNLESYTGLVTITLDFDVEWDCLVRDSQIATSLSEGYVVSPNPAQYWAINYQLWVKENSFDLGFSPQILFRRNMIGEGGDDGRYHSDDEDSPLVASTLRENNNGLGRVTEVTFDYSTTSSLHMSASSIFNTTESSFGEDIVFKIGLHMGRDKSGTSGVLPGAQPPIEFSYAIRNLLITLNTKKDGWKVGAI